MQRRIARAWRLTQALQGAHSAMAASGGTDKLLAELQFNPGGKDADPKTIRKYLRAVSEIPSAAPLHLPLLAVASPVACAPATVSSRIG